MRAPIDRRPPTNHPSNRAHIHKLDTERYMDPAYEPPYKVDRYTYVYIYNIILLKNHPPNKIPKHPT